MKKYAWKSRQTIALDSSFGHPPTVIQLRSKWSYSTTIIKKKMFWPKHAKPHDVIEEMQGKDAETIRARKGYNDNGGIKYLIHFVALADSKNASAMLTN